MNKYNYDKLTPFKWFVLENFPFIEADFDALTEWQLFCKIGKEINKIINSENTLGLQVENLTDSFIKLQNYVDNYFVNLDLQEEINTKLNEMATDGTLAEIINQEIFTDINNNISELKTNLLNTNNLISQKSNMLELMLYMIFDSNNNENHQGGCIDNENNLYMYKYTGSDENLGKIEKYSLETCQLLSVSPDLPGKHGNSMEFLNNKIYICTATSNEILVYDTTTQTYETINPFANTNLNYVLSVSNYDENHLLFILSSTNAIPKPFNDLHLFILNINNYSYKEINITNNLPYTPSYLTIPDLAYDKDLNCLYYFVSGNNDILNLSCNDLLGDNPQVYLNGVYNLPEKNNFGFPLGEGEFITHWKNGNFIIMSKTIPFANAINEMIEIHLINPVNSVQKFKRTLNNQSINNGIIYVDSTKNNNILYEDGTSDFPFKQLRRAFWTLNYSNLNYARILTNGEFEIGADTEIFVRINGQNKTTFKTTDHNLFTNCNGVVTNAKIEYSGNEPLNITNSNMYFIGCNFNFVNDEDITLNNVLTITDNSNICLQGGSFNISDNITVTNGILISNSSKLKTSVNVKGNNITDKKFKLASAGQLNISNNNTIPTTDVTFDTSNTTVITAGLH
jgi:hypothetical protein